MIETSTDIPMLETATVEPQTTPIEQFNTADLSSLREEIIRAGMDSWQAADLISNFLSGRGYGVSAEDARRAASRMDGYSIKGLQEELGKLALVM
jgi:hypothetical protein